jgi:hypothetical protein
MEVLVIFRLHELPAKAAAVSDESGDFLCSPASRRADVAVVASETGVCRRR